MNSVYDVQQLLKKFGIFIYVGDRLADLELMEIELTALYQENLISIQEYRQAKLLLRKEQRLMKKGEKDDES